MIHELISKRHSTRAYSDKIITEEELKDLFEAARWSPSSRNEQPWRFIYATKEDPEEYSKIADLLNESNKIWAQNAPLLILGIVKLDSDFTKQLNRAAFYDMGGAVANLTTQAVSMGLAVHQMGGFNLLKAREVFEIPENFEPAIVLAVGSKGNIEDLPESLKQRELTPRRRKELSELVFKEKFGYPADNLSQKEVQYTIIQK